MVVGTRFILSQFICFNLHSERERERMDDLWSLKWNKTYILWKAWSWRVHIQSNGHAIASIESTYSHTSFRFGLLLHHTNHTWKQVSKMEEVGLVHNPSMLSHDLQQLLSQNAPAHEQRKCKITFPSITY